MSVPTIGLKASGLLQITSLIEAVKKNDPDEVLVLGCDVTKNPVNFIISKKGLENEMKAQLVMEKIGLDSKVIAMNNLNINQFKNLLISIGVSPSLVMNDVNDFAIAVDGFSVDEGSIFHDEKGNCLTVAHLNDERSLLDMLNGVGEHNVMVTFDGAAKNGGKSGQTHSIAAIRAFIESKELRSVF